MQRLSPRLAVGLFGLALLLLLGASTGCSKESGKGIISGKVTYKGEAVPGGILKVHSATGETIQGDIRRDGTFQVSGVPPGSAKVTVDNSALAEQLTNPGAKAYIEKSPNMGLYREIPARYADTASTDVIWEVKRGKQTLNAELKD
jgi:hypothetical protein